MAPSRDWQQFYGNIVLKLTSHPLSVFLVPFFSAWWGVRSADFISPATLRALFIRFPICIDSFRPLTHASIARPCDGRARVVDRPHSRVKRHVDLDDCCDPRIYDIVIVFSLYPRDFHHVFSPVDGRVTKVQPIEGILRYDPTRCICKNRRVCIDLSTAFHSKISLILSLVRSGLGV